MYPTLYTWIRNPTPVTMSMSVTDSGSTRKLTAAEKSPAASHS
jgi:hypothetical protein